MRGGLHPQQSLRTPFLGGTVFAKPRALLLPSPSRRKERKKVAKKKKKSGELLVGEVRDNSERRNLVLR